jgi:hypothetical protein
MGKQMLILEELILLAYEVHLITRLNTYHAGRCEIIRVTGV